MLTIYIDAIEIEGEKVVTADIPGVFLQSNWSKDWL